MAKHEKLMFMDSDISPSSDVDWFKKVYDALDKGLFTQGFSTITYMNKDGQADVKKISYTSSLVKKGRVSGVPGGVYCICKSTLNAIGGFNFLPLGGGDDLFWCEFLGKDNRPVLLVNKRMSVIDTMTLLMKTTGKKRVADVPVDICHFYHGERKMRSYGQR